MYRQQVEVCDHSPNTGGCAGAHRPVWGSPVEEKHWQVQRSHHNGVGEPVMDGEALPYTDGHKSRVGDVLGAKSCLEYLFPSPPGWEMFRPK